MKKIKLWFKEFFWTLIPIIILLYLFHLNGLINGSEKFLIIFWIMFSAVTATNILLPQYRMIKYWNLNKQNSTFSTYNEAYKVQRRIFFIFWRKIYETNNKEMAENLLNLYLK